MGCNNSKISVDASETSKNIYLAQKQNKSAFEYPIDIPITYSDFADSEVQIKILLIGPSSCGKTTLWNNFEINLLNSNQDYENESKAIAIKKYLIEASKSLFKVIQLKGIEVDTLNLKPPTEDNLTYEFSNNILSIWTNKKVQKSYKQNDNFGFYSNESFFLSNSTRIANKNYKPTKEDILKCHFHQKGSSSSLFLVNNTIKAELIDITYQNISFYEKSYKGINYLIFVVSLSDFDGNLFGESINLLNQVIDSSFFTNIPIFLLLNKTDLFEQRLRNYPQKFLNEFPDFSGCIGNIDSCINHIKSNFFREMQKNKNFQADMVEIIPICAINEQNCRSFFQIIAQRIIGIPKKQKDENSDKFPKDNQDKNIKENDESETPNNNDQNPHKSENKKCQKNQQSANNTKTPKEPPEKKTTSNSPRDHIRSSTPKSGNNSQNIESKNSAKNKHQEQLKSKAKVSRKSSEKSTSESSQRKHRSAIKVIHNQPLREKEEDEISVYEYASEYVTDTDSYSEYYNSSYFY